MLNWDKVSPVQRSKEDLLGIIEKIKDLPVLVVGDIMLDRYIWGKVERISQEAPVPVVQVTKIEDRLGGAGNVVRNLQSLGARVSVCGFISDDEEGQTVLKLLDRDGVGKDGVIVDRSCPTTLKTRVIAHNQQVVRIDRENVGAKSPALREAFAALVDAHIDESKALILSDYGKGGISESLIKKIGDAKAAKRIGLGIRPFVIDPHPSNYHIYNGMTVAKPNRKEAEAGSGIKITDRASALKAASILAKKWNADIMLVSLGEGGLLVLSKENPEGLFVESTALQVFDVSGAGDTVTATFSAALAAGATLAQAGDLANIAAGIVVAEVGTVPIDRTKLQREVERLSKRD